MTREMLKYAVPALLTAALLSGGARADGVGPAADWPGGNTTAAFGNSARGETGLAANARAGESAAAEGGTAGEGGLLAGMSPGDRKIASALYQAQGKSRIDLHDIARARRGGSGWSEIFKRMKAGGLVREKNVGQVLSKYARREPGGEGMPAADAGNGSQPRGQGLKSLGIPATHPPGAMGRSKLKPTARPDGGKPGSRSLLTLALVRQVPHGGGRTAAGNDAAGSNNSLAAH